MKKNRTWLLALICLCLALTFTTIHPANVQAASIRWTKLQKKYLKNSKVDRLIFVQYTKGTKCVVKMYRKVRNKKGKLQWQRIVKTSGYVGQNGMGKKKAGDKKTPVGTFTIGEAFGILDNPGTSIKYTKLNKYLYWSGVSDETYNSMIDKRIHPRVSNSEHLLYIDPEYEYALDMGYNRKRTIGKGSALFLHCTGAKKYTGGCVAVPREKMKKILQYCTTGTKICIYKQ